MSSKYLRFALLVSTLVISIQSRPLDDDEVEVELSPPLQSNPLRLKQEDTDDDEILTTPPYQFGAQVAQIIKGAVTGDLSSILTGSFNLVPDQQTSSAINGAWGTIAGLTTTTTTTTTTTEATTTEPTEPSTVRAAAEVSTEGPPPPVVEEETEEPKFEEGSSTTESEAEEKVSSTTEAEDDDDEEAEAEELERVGSGISDNESSNLEENSVFSRSKVLRVI